MVQIDLNSLGITQEELTERIVERISRDLLFVEIQEPDGHGRHYSASDDSAFSRLLQTRIQQRIDAAVSAIAERTVLPEVGALIENFAIQKTNEWGERKGEPVTFVEYLTARADAYLREQVDGDGRTKDEQRGSYWTGRTTRIAYMIDRHLHHHIHTAMTKALADANSSIVGGIQKAVEMKLAEIQGALKVTVTTK